MFSLAINNQSSTSLPGTQILSLCRFVLSSLKIKNAELSLAFVSLPVMRRLNLSYRGQNRATDVLSFIFDGSKKNLSGEIIICLPVAKSQARHFNHPLYREIFRLLVHGLVHLAGYDHVKAKDAVVMENLENRLLQLYILSARKNK
ncbi:rRNA maturation RNase YbeY [Candidatus Kuenenbacteria bacterium]|nr:rRNA maturation RNase YbeY [Candidatus Kuenenbacteria bacterium]